MIVAAITCIWTIAKNMGLTVNEILETLHGYQSNYRDFNIQI